MKLLDRSVPKWGLVFFIGSFGSYHAMAQQSDSPRIYGTGDKDQQVLIFQNQDDGEAYGYAFDCENTIAQGLIAAMLNQDTPPFPTMTELEPFDDFSEDTTLPCTREQEDWVQYNDKFYLNMTNNGGNPLWFELAHRSIVEAYGLDVTTPTTQGTEIPSNILKPLPLDNDKTIIPDQPTIIEPSKFPSTMYGYPGQKKTIEFTIRDGVRAEQVVLGNSEQCEIESVNMDSGKLVINTMFAQDRCQASFKIYPSTGNIGTPLEFTISLDTNSSFAGWCQSYLIDKDRSSENQMFSPSQIATFKALERAYGQMEENECSTWLGNFTTNLDNKGIFSISSQSVDELIETIKAEPTETSETCDHSATSSKCLEIKELSALHWLSTLPEEDLSSIKAFSIVNSGLEDISVLASILRAIDISEDSQSCDDFLLNLSANRISSVADLEGLNIPCMNLAGNRITGSIGGDKFPSLRELDLSFNKLDSTSEFKGLESLVSLNLSANSLISSPTINPEGSLAYLNISNTDLSLIGDDYNGKIAKIDLRLNPDLEFSSLTQLDIGDQQTLQISLLVNGPKITQGDCNDLSYSSCQFTDFSDDFTDLGL